MLLPVTRYSSLAAPGLFGLASCSKSEEGASANRISFNNFEAVDGWVPANPSLTTTKAHSGRYAIKVDQEAEYSLGYTNLLGRASVSKLRKLELHGWVYPTGPKATASLIVQIVDPAKDNQAVFWGALDVSQDTKPNEWNEVRKQFTLPDNIEAAHQLRVYLWRSSAEQPVYLDDLEILKGE